MNANELNLNFTYTYGLIRRGLMLSTIPYRGLRPSFRVAKARVI